MTFRAQLDPSRGCASLAAATALAAALLAPALGQTTSDSPLAPPPNGVAKRPPRIHVLRPGVLHVAPGEEIIGGAVLVVDDRIAGVLDEAAAAEMEWPAGARVHELPGAHVYAGFIDPYVEVAAPAPDPSAAGAHWSSQVTPQRSALDGDGLDTEQATALRARGVTAAGVAPSGGVFRGAGAVVSTAARSPDAGDAEPPVYLPIAFHTLAFEVNPPQSDRYPVSQMGAVALMRQTLADAAYEAEAGHEGASCLDALRADAPLLFVTDHEIKAIHALETAAEAGRPALVLDSGRGYWRLDDYVLRDASVLCPVAFPEAPDVASPSDADVVELRDLMHWEQAPTNPWRLARAGLQVSITGFGADDFFEGVRASIASGLTETEALAMVTTSPASQLGVDGLMGTIRDGKLANLVVSSGPVFDEDSEIREVWVDGVRHEVNAPPPPSIDGVWRATLAGAFELTLEIEAEDGAVESVTVIDGEERREGERVTYDDGGLSFVFDHTGFGGQDGYFTMSAALDDGALIGDGTRTDGLAFTWIATKTGDLEVDDDADDDEEQEATLGPPGDLPGYPFGPYAFLDVPTQPDVVLIRDATIWTSSDRGIIENGWMLVHAGTIDSLGNADPPSVPDDAVVIDAAGRHVTPGIIDAHSHTGTYPAGFYVNEASQAVTSEVRIADCFDPGHINWYRELAGGATAANVLHGSANPIGGQNLIVKNRWGAAGIRDTALAGAMPGIKFALGENVTQSNGLQAQNRYPRTRMGVETLMRDRFIAAQAYDAERAAAEDAGLPFRRDLELEAIAEILAGERLIHCHSYRQDEILMLGRLSQEFGFTIGSYQHVLEGYKVAEVIRDVALGGSTFADWWAYKFEVYDAIPENGAIMREAGVNVSFNSDRDWLACHLNTEAAKAVRYGGVTPAAALEFVTINPAIQLAIAHRVGSLEPGKDADFVIWSGDPLSTLTRCESTWIDGREYFSLEKDLALRQRNQAERARIIQKILSTSNAGDDDDDEHEDGESDPEALAYRRELYHRALILHAEGIDPTMVPLSGCGCEGHAISHTHE